MRPNDKWKSDAKVNEIVESYWQVFADVFVAPPTPAHPPLENSNFFRDLYVCFRDGYVPGLSVDQEVLEGAEIGTREHNLLSAMLHTEHRLVALIGDVGRGKTSLLKYALQYLPTVFPPLAKRIRICNIDCYQNRASLRGTDANASVSVKCYFDHQLRLAVSGLLREVAGPRNDQFWDTITSIDEFFALQAFETGVRQVRGEAEARNAILEKRLAEQQQDEFYLKAMPYFELQGVRFVLVFDNVDALPHELQVATLVYAREICNRRRCRCIVAMRRKTWHQISKHMMQHGHGMFIELESRDVSAVIRRRTESVLSKLATAEPGRQAQLPANGSTHVTLSSVKIERSILLGNLQRLHEHILHSDRIRVISELACENLRVALRLAFRAYQSERWRTTDFLAPLLGLPRDDVVPEHVFLEALLRGRSRTFISRSADEGILNVFTNKHSTHPLARFVRPLLLGRMRSARQQAVPASVLLREAEAMFPGAAEVAVEQVRYAVFRLLNAGLLESPEVHFLDKLDDLRSDIAVQISRAGEYYLESFAWNFTYLLMMKDDICFDSERDVPYPISMHCETINEKARSVLGFIDYMASVETSVMELAGVPKNSTFQRWMAGVTAQPAVALEMCRAVVKFATVSRRVSQEVETEASLLEQRLRSRFENLRKEGR